MKKKLLIISAVITALIGGAAFAASPTPIARVFNGDKPPVTSTSQTRVADTAPVVEETAPQAVSATAQATAPSQPAQSQTAATAPEATPEQPAEPVTPPAPVTVTQIQGAGVSSIARPYVDSFTCIYFFSDGTKVSRLTPYSIDAEDHAVAVCPEWR